MDCPYCYKEKHLYYNPHKGVFYCFRCGKSGHAAELRARGVHVRRDPNLFNSDISYRVGEGLEDPPEYTDLTTDSEEYLTDRGVHASIRTLLRQKIYETRKGLLFLYPDKDYWQERRWEVFSPPRWVNPSIAPTSSSAGCVYHLRTHFDSNRVVLVEGIFDALRVAPYANVCAMLSKEYHSNQLMAIRGRGYDEVTFIPDKDVPLSTVIGYSAKCAAWFPIVSMFKGLVADDPGDESDDILSCL